MPKAARINLKPLVGVLKRQDLKPALNTIAQEIAKALKAEIQSSAFSDAAKKRLHRGIQIEVGERSVTVSSDDPAFVPLLKGQRPGQMTWLQKSESPIPIVTDTGEVLFRNATAKSMQDGSWYHPGRKPSRVLDRARKKARDIAREKIPKVLSKSIADAMVRAAKKGS